MIRKPEEARAFIAERSLVHKKASHNCWGYKTGVLNTVEAFSSDDGEPSGTAGKPIIGSIERNQITNVAIVVTRYFGGKKLGIRGLIDAYSSVAEATVKESGIYKYQSMKRMQIICGYQEWNRVAYDLGKFDIHFDKSKLVFTTEVSIPIEVQEEKLSVFLQVLERYIHNGLKIRYEVDDETYFSPVKL